MICQDGYAHVFRLCLQYSGDNRVFGRIQSTGEKPKYWEKVKKKFKKSIKKKF